MPATMTRRSWADVTIAQYAALNLLQDNDTVKWLDAYWDETAALNPFKGPDDPPCRLSDDVGVPWLEAKRELVRNATDEADLQLAAQHVLDCLGTLCVMGAARIRREAAHADPQ